MVALDWFDEPAGTPAKLRIDTGWGFPPAVWMSVAQVVSNAKGLLQCDGCGNYYVRRGRKPAAGRRNYCPACGKKAAKRDWATAHRTKS